jgi:hypothetical protein
VSQLEVVLEVDAISKDLITWTDINSQPFVEEKLLLKAANTANIKMEIKETLKETN